MSINAATEGSFGHLARATSKMMDQLHKGFFVYSPDTWTPNVNLYETANAYFVCADLAGVEKDKIDLEVLDQRLSLRGSRPVPATESPEAGSAGESEGEPPARRVKLHLMEIDHGAFRREVELPPDADLQGISATYRNGLLWIEIPKK